MGVGVGFGRIAFRGRLLAVAAVMIGSAAVPPAAVAAHSTVHHFAGGVSDGALPSSTLIRGRDGFFYGTTTGGGASNGGTVYRMDGSGRTTVLHSFSQTGAAGYSPRAELMQASDGYLYGTTAAGGGASCPFSDACGSVFRISAAGALTIVHRFTGSASGGAFAAAPLIQGRDGALYSTTRNGGAKNRGTVYRVTTSGAFRLLHSFTGSAEDSSGDGMWPLAALAEKEAGTFYGTTSRHYFSSTGFGTVFKVTASGAFQTLRIFKRNDGAHPSARLLVGADGFLYGTTRQGGAANFGTIFRISSTGAFRLVHSFDAYGSTGVYPLAGLIQGPDGTLYGTASEGGQPVGNGNTEGVIFKMHPTSYRVGVLRTFYESGDGSSAPGGREPGTQLLLAGGSLYGTTALGGTYNRGVVYRQNLTAPATLALLGFSRSSVWGGDPANDSATGTVMLDGLAPSGGAVVSLVSSRPGVIPVPASVTVAPGWSTVDFAVRAAAVAAETQVTISATYNGVTRRATVTVYPLG